MKKFSAFLTVCCLALSALCVDAKAQTEDSSCLSAAQIADSLVNLAHKYLGTPYRLGANGPSSFDCSGFTTFIYDKFGYTLSPSSAAQFAQGRQVTGSYSDLQKGDVLVFASRHDYSTPGHVAIYIGPDEEGKGFTFIHASVRNGITVTNINETYYNTRFLGARRFLPDIARQSDSQLAYLDSLLIPGAQSDTSRLDDSVKHIALLKNGSWAYLDGGKMVPPGPGDSFVLSSDGSWLDQPNSENKIPEAKPAQTPSPAKTPSKPKAVYHTIKSGDTLSGIAARNHTSVKALCKLNGISEKAVLKIGKKIRVK